jgi:uncharacterized protein
MFHSFRMAVCDSPLRGISSSITNVSATAGGTTLRIAVIASMILVASTALAFQRGDVVSRTELLLAIGVFLGATTSAFTGFAFSAVAGALVLHVRTPIEAVPLMMVCSTLVQSASLVSLFHTINWRGSIVLILGGALGVPLALFLLVHTDTITFRVGFGTFLALYATYMFLRSARCTVLEVRGRMQGAAIGFAGGVVGGLTAMPGALPTIWCDLRGLPKDRQRGLVQPFIAIMQILALAILLYEHELSADILKDLLVSLPSLAAGTALGLVLFRVANEAIFRRVVLIALFVSGLALIA